MQSQQEVDNISKSVKNCFGFNENEVNLSILNNSSILNETSAVIEFQPDKPYRLALYVRPHEQRKIQKANASLIVKSVMEKQMKIRQILNNTNCSIAKKTENNKGKKKEKKFKSVMLFDEKPKPETESKTDKKTGNKLKLKKNVTITEFDLPQKNILSESNTKSFPSLRQTTIKRLYERKLRKREEETENIPDEPPSDQIIKCLEDRKYSRTKQKKFYKEDEEFENWASNVNSGFNDVDQFELSVTYD